MVVLSITLACVAFGAVAAAYSSFPHVVRDRRREAVLVALLLPAVAATFIPSSPTGIPLWDLVLVIAFVVAVAAAAAGASRRAVLAVASAVALLAVLGGSGLPAAFLGLGTAVGVGAIGVRLPAPKALAGGWSGVALLDLGWPDGEPARVVVAGALVLGLGGAALLRAGARPRRTALVGALAATGAAGAIAALFGVQAAAARAQLDEAGDAARVGLAAARDGRLADATVALARAELHFARARHRLDVAAAWPARLLPGVAQNARAMSAVARSGEELAGAAAQVAVDIEVDDLRVRRGRLDLDEVAAARRALAEISGLLRASTEDLAGARSAMLLPPVADAVETFAVRLEDAATSTTTSLEILRVLPRLLGADGPRRWFVGLMGASEARAAGGIIGSHGILTAEDGALDLGPLGRTAELNRSGSGDRRLAGPPDYVARYARYAPEWTWQNITMSPDGPSIGEVIEDLHPQAGGVPVDGVIVVDHVGLAALLQLTGPVRVPEWPEPLTPTNLGDILLHEQYLRFDRPDRVDFLADAARAVFDRITASDLPPPSDITSALRGAIAGRHLFLHSAHDREQALFERLGLDGALPPVEGDFLAVVTQNGSGNKIDWFLDRTVTYDATVDPRSDEVAGELTIRLDNRAPAAGLPHYVIGGVGDDPTEPGESRLILSVYSALSLLGAEIDGEPLALRTERELGRWVHEAVVRIPPGGSVTVRIQLRGEVAANGRYRLDVRPQPTVRPDALRIVVRSGRDRVAHDEELRTDTDHRVVVDVGE